MPQKLVDGELVDLTPQEEAELAANEQQWLDEEPQRAARQQRNSDLANNSDRVDLMYQLHHATNAQIDQWIDSKVTDLASVRKMFKIILKTMARADVGT